jgi:hypothetical protein
MVGELASLGTEFVANYLLLKTVPFFFMTVQLDLDGLSANEIARQSY